MGERLFLAVIAVGLGAGAVSADIYSESGDAGQSVGTAQSVVGVSSLTQISGGLLPGGQGVDIYRILINDYANFSADTFGSFSFDTQLFLFDANGYGIYSNDDRPGGGGVTSLLPAGHADGPSSNGIYLLAVSAFNNDPISASGNIFDPSNNPNNAIGTPTGIGGGDALSGWTDSGGGFGGYAINLTGATAVPVPGAALLAMLGLPAIGWVRRRAAA